MENTPSSAGAPPERAVKRTAKQVEVDRLKRKNDKLTRLVKRQETVIDILGKTAALMEQFSESADNESHDLDKW